MVEPDSILGEQNGAAILQPDGQRRKREERRRQQQSEASQDDVAGALNRSKTGSRAIWNPSWK